MRAHCPSFRGLIGLADTCTVAPRAGCKPATATALLWRSALVSSGSDCNACSVTPLAASDEPAMYTLCRPGTFGFEPPPLLAAGTCRRLAVGQSTCHPHRAVPASPSTQMLVKGNRGQICGVAKCSSRLSRAVPGVGHGGGRDALKSRSGTVLFNCDIN